MSNLATGDRVTGADIRDPRAALQRNLVSIPNNAVTDVTWSSALYDPDALWDGAKALVVKRAGLYIVHISARFATQAAVVGLRQARVNVNGVEAWSQNDSPTTAQNSFNTMAVLTYPIPLAVGDSVSFSVYQNSGGALDLLASTRAALWWVG